MTASLEALRRSPHRLQAVRDSGLLDSPAEESFDALTRLAATLVGAPASFLSVVDADRDFYKSEHGLAEALAGERELAGPTFCHHTLQQEGPLVIDDTWSEPRWRAVSTVDSLGVRAYLGVPLRVDGETIGSFCVIDTRPRTWSAVEIDTMVQLATSAGREVRLRGALREAIAQAGRAQAAVRAKEGVVASIAHDLRTPLQVVKLNAILLQHTASAQQRVATQRVLDSVNRMASMTDELLVDSFEAADEGRERAIFEVSVLLGDVIDTMAVIAARAGIGLVLGPTPPQAPVRVDYGQMLRVFCNLVGNAVKYSPAGSTVRLGADFAGAEVRLTVVDDGPGMSEGDVARAFERGWQGQRGDGAGLGLAIVLSLVERHGGHVALTSRPGGGTTVSVCLPALHTSKNTVSPSP